ncbi:MAG: zinc metallopeptidase [Gammaproteobacteria bacterium]|nr:zinc metallopeptidase [Gammaproteobacteria bacterium]
MLWVIGLIFLFVLVFGPTLWVRWVIKAHSEDLEGVPGTGGELAEHLLTRLGVDGVGVEVSPGGDHYDPQARMVRLSQDNYTGKSLSAIAIAAHEVGHAMQHHRGDVRLAARTRLAPLADKIARLSSSVIWIAPIAGLLFRHPVPFSALVLVGVSGLIARLLVHLVTLPTEWDASFGKALPVLMEGQYIAPGEEVVLRKILRAAAMTYAAAALADVLNLFRWAALLLRR